MTLEKLSKRSASLRSISLALIFMLIINYVFSYLPSYDKIMVYVIKTKQIKQLSSL